VVRKKYVAAKLPPFPSDNRDATRRVAPFKERRKCDHRDANGTGGPAWYRVAFLEQRGLFSKEEILND